MGSSRGGSSSGRSSSSSSSSSRSGSSRSSSSGSSRGGSRNSSTSSGFNLSGPSRNTYRPGYRQTNNYYGNRGYNSRRTYAGDGYRRRSSGPMTTFKMCCILVVVAIGCIMIGVVLNTILGTGNITASTVVRKPLPKGVVVETDYYNDTLDWIGNRTQLQKGMIHFYQKTGVQPHLLIVDNILGDSWPTDEKAFAYLDSYYNEKFKDEAHIILCFLEVGNDYKMWLHGGAQTKIVLDNEAHDILLDYVELYYFNTSISDEEMFSRAFEKAADDMMTIKGNNVPLPALIFFILGGLNLLGLVIFVVVKFFFSEQGTVMEEVEQRSALDDEEG